MKPLNALALSLLLGSANFMFALELNLNESFLAKKVSSLSALVNSEEKKLFNRQKNAHLGMQLLSGLIAFGPYIALYYQESLPVILIENVKYTLPPWSIFTYTMTLYKSFERTDALISDIERDLEPLKTILPELIKLIEKIEDLSDQDLEAFLVSLDDLRSTNLALDNFFRDLLLKALDKYRGNTKLEAAAQDNRQSKLLIIYSLVKILERSDPKFDRFILEKPTIYLAILEIGKMSFHSYQTFLNSLAHEFRDDVEILDKELADRIEQQRPCCLKILLKLLEKSKKNDQ